ncbi:MAG: glycosyltransferase family 9 protein [Syntrophobacteraceae bacterium]
MIKDNPDIDELYIYEKAKHAPDKNKLSVWWDNFKVFARIRKERYDVAIACGSYSPTLAKYTFFTGAKLKMGYGKKDALDLFYNRPAAPLAAPVHEVLRVANLLAPLGIHDGPGKLILVPDDAELKKFEVYKKNALKDSSKPLLAIAISARIKANKWSTERFVELINKILLHETANVLILWAPGSENNPTFPGDNESADRIRRNFEGRIIAYPTPSLKALIAAIAGSDVVITLDTGSLHMAAALGKIMVAMMTKGKAQTWYPWKTRNIVIAAENAVDEIQADSVLQALDECMKDFHGA